MMVGKPLVVEFPEIIYLASLQKQHDEIILLS